MRMFLRFFSLLVTTSLLAQSPPFASDLRAPTRIGFTHQKNLIVTEQGGAQPNTGRISIIDRSSGVRRTLVDGLPSAIFTGAEPAAPSGPAGFALQGQTLYVTIGGGDATVAGPAPASEQPNPAGPSSPIFASVLALRPSGSLDTTQGGFVLQRSQQDELKSRSTVTLTNGAGERLSITLLADVPDFVASPRPDFAGNVKNANLFSATIQGGALYVADAAQNKVRKFDLNSGAESTVASFPLIANPLPFGPPMIEAVPDAVQVRGNQLLVTTLTGFPFPAGRAAVYRVDVQTGTITEIASGLVTAVDLESIGESPSSPLLVVEFSTDILGGAPGRLQLVREGQQPVAVAENLITPVGVAFDRHTGEAFVAQIGPGTVVRLDLSDAVPLAGPHAVIAGAAAAEGAHGSRWVTHSLLHNPHPFTISGRIVFHPQGRSAANDDPSLAYSLAPFETRAFPDLVGAAGGSGVGSLDIIAAVGGPPVMTVRIVDEASSGRSAGLMPLLDPAAALSPGFTGTLVTPPDIAVQRFNVGIRTMSEGATIVVTLRDAGGRELGTRTLILPPNYGATWTAEQLMEMAVGGVQSLTFDVQQGAAFVYGAAVRNDGSGMLIQSPRAVAVD